MKKISTVPNFLVAPRKKKKRKVSQLQSLNFNADSKVDQVFFFVQGKSCYTIFSLHLLWEFNFNLIEHIFYRPSTLDYYKKKKKKKTSIVFNKSSFVFQFLNKKATHETTFKNKYFSTIFLWNRCYTNTSLSNGSENFIVLD